jgi:YVTN family beta-propeller protein
MRAPIIRGLCAVAVGAAIVPLGLAGTAGATASPACRAHHVTVYVVNQGSGTVTPISTATNTAGQEINVGKDPYGIAITPNGRTAYVTHVATFPPGIVTPINLATGTAGTPIKFGQGPQVIAITPNERTVYAVDMGPGTVTPIRTATNTVGKPIPVGSFPFAIAITPNGRPLTWPTLARTR